MVTSCTKLCLTVATGSVDANVSVEVVVRRKSNTGETRW